MSHTVVVQGVLCNVAANEYTDNEAFTRLVAAMQRLKAITSHYMDRCCLTSQFPYGRGGEGGKEKGQKGQRYTKQAECLLSSSIFCN